ncbi:hypothetical protein N7456_005194 [Penicillium angulare]|uniref:Major facilitator superfamily (MFS) profile domain-containing protein n=1 Tax=Penicillium angulare TaxID=116970 RepID=A0A9W9FXW8_9EURO|nr:hypothetical protein N7456_005194 [Penicillium angulare]
MVGYSGGGAIGGTLYTWVGWRWSFLLHVPIVLACALTTVLQLPKDTPTDRQSTPVNTQGQKEESPDTEKLDYIGISLLVCAIVTALMMVQVFQADEIPENKLYFTIALGSVSLLLGIAFCIYEMCWAETPLIPLSFMLSSKTGVICAVQILTMIADMSFASAVSEYFVRTKGFSMAAASACLAPAGLGGAVGGILAGKYIQRFERKALVHIHHLPEG